MSFLPVGCGGVLSPLVPHRNWAFHYYPTYSLNKICHVCVGSQDLEILGFKAIIPALRELNIANKIHSLQHNKSCETGSSRLREKGILPGEDSTEEGVFELGFEGAWNSPPKRNHSQGVISMGEYITSFGKYYRSPALCRAPERIRQSPCILYTSAGEVTVDWVLVLMCHYKLQWALGKVNSRMFWEKITRRKLL